MIIVMESLEALLRITHTVGISKTVSCHSAIRLVSFPWIAHSVHATEEHFCVCKELQ